jgi:hypothetical protein
VNETRNLIDKHFTENYKSYKSVCRKKFGGRYVYEDLLHELYIMFIDYDSEKIRRYSDNGKLHILGLCFIQKIFAKRNNKKKYKAESSNLLEISTSVECSDNMFMIEDIEPELISDEKIEKVKAYLIKGVLSGDTDLNLFAMAQVDNLYSIHKKTGINRKSLQDSYGRAQLKLKRIIND